MDISMCSNEKCTRKNCRRHLDNAKEGFYSCADFNVENENECEWFWEMPVKK